MSSPRKEVSSCYYYYYYYYYSIITTTITITILLILLSPAEILISCDPHDLRVHLFTFFYVKAPSGYGFTVFCAFMGDAGLMAAVPSPDNCERGKCFCHCYYQQLHCDLASGQSTVKAEEKALLRPWTTKSLRDFDLLLITLKAKLTFLEDYRTWKIPSSKVREKIISK